MNTHPLLSLVCGFSLASIGSTAVAATGAIAPWGAPAWLSQTLVLDHPGSIDEFGSAVALEGSTLMVGAPLYPQNAGGNGGQGEVLVYTYADGQWTFWQTLAASDATPGAAFGSRIVIRGDVAVIAAPTENVDPFTLQGAVYTFELVGGQWTEMQKLTKAAGTAYDNYFGESIAFDGTTIVIGETAAGASTGNPPGGGAYVFTRVGDQWTQTTDLYETDGDQLDAFGRAVGVSGDTIFVSSPETRWDANGAGPGSVHRFARTGDTWTETQLIQADTPARGEYFGESMAVDGPLAIFSAPGATLGGMQFAGRIFVFEFDGAQWMQREVIQVPDEDATELAGFGASLAIRGTQLAVGAPGVTVADVPFSGAAYLYDIAGDALMEKRFVADDPISGDYFGYAVALQLGGWQVASGVPHAFDDGSGNPGSTYVFTNDDVVFASGFD